MYTHSLFVKSKEFKTTVNFSFLTDLYWLKKYFNRELEIFEILEPTKGGKGPIKRQRNTELKIMSEIRTWRL